MKLAVSNICWNSDGRDSEIYRFLSDVGIDGIEVAPSKISDTWPDIKIGDASSIYYRLSDLGFEIPSLQSLFFNMSGLSFVGDETEFHKLMEHIIKLCDVSWSFCSLDDDIRFVFGSPGVRMNAPIAAIQSKESHSYSVLVSRMRLISDILKLRSDDYIFCVEPAPIFYGGENVFLPRASDVIDFVRTVDRENIKAHLDTGCTWMGDEDVCAMFAMNMDIVGHVHASEPRLAPINDDRHRAVADLLKKRHPFSTSKWVSLEQAPTDIETFKASVLKFIDLYGGD
jgi:sugar phosphate isomerase/epimerase